MILFPLMISREKTENCYQKLIIICASESKYCAGRLSVPRFTKCLPNSRQDRLSSDHQSGEGEISILIRLEEGDGEHGCGL